MIEVEKKFLLTDTEEKSLLDGAEFVNERTFSDTYYDTKDYRLTRQDIWLRSRDDTFELKVPFFEHNQNSPYAMDQYREIMDEKTIRHELDLSDQDDFSATLTKAGYATFCTCTTTRKKYVKEGFTIDIDTVIYKNDTLTFKIAEIELMINSDDDVKAMEMASQKIVEFAKKYRLKIQPVRGKVVTYLKERKSEHFTALLAAGVIRG